MIGESGNRRWRAFWWDADGKHARVLGRAWAKNSGKRTPRGAIVWHVADGPKPDPSYLTPREAQGQLRRLLEHEAVTVATPAAPKGTPVTFADAAEAWLLHGERKRALKRSTLTDYRQALDAYLLPATPNRTRPDTAYGRAPFATTPLREIRSTQLKEWYEGLPYGRTAEKLLMIVRAILGHARSRGWIEADPSGTVERQEVRYSGDYDFYSLEEIDALVRAAANEQDAAIFLTAAMTGLRRGELIALRWRDIDFTGQAIRVRANFSYGSLSHRRAARSGACRWSRRSPRRSPASGSANSSPPTTTQCSPARSAGTSRERPPQSLRTSGEASRAAALPFHSLRHYFGSMAVNRASLVQAQSWMGHSEIQTTARYLHAKSQAQDAAILASAFTRPSPGEPGEAGNHLAGGGARSD